MPPPNYTPTGGSTNRERGADRNRSQTLSPSVRARNTASMNKVKAKQGKDKLDNYQVSKVPAYVPGAFILNAGQNVRQKTFEVNRDYFRKNVVGKGGYTDTFDSYETYIKGRSSGTLDAMGRPINTGGGNDNTLLSQAPTSGVVTNTGIVGSNAMKTPEEIKKEEEKKKNETGLIAAKRRGRSETILTGSTGLGDEDDLIRRKTLLG
jgi:hypothetical protein